MLNTPNGHTMTLKRITHLVPQPLKENQNSNIKLDLLFCHILPVEKLLGKYVDI